MTGFLLVIGYIIGLLVGYEWITSSFQGSFFVGGAGVGEEDTLAVESFEEGTYYYTFGAMILGLMMLGSIQMFNYIWKSIKIIKKIIRNSWADAMREGAADVVADIDVPTPAEIDVPPPPVPRVRREPRGVKFLGVTDVNTIKDSRNRPRTHTKKLHSSKSCRGLTSSTSPLTGILEVEISIEGLCRHCHDGDALATED